MLPDASGALVDDGCVICKGKEHRVSKDTLQAIGRTLRPVIVCQTSTSDQPVEELNKLLLKPVERREYSQVLL